MLGLPAEVEWVEFKEAKNKFDFDDMGKYFSANLLAEMAHKDKKIIPSGPKRTAEWRLRDEEK